MSSDDDIPPTPPDNDELPSNSRKLNIVMFRKVRRRQIEETIDVSSDSTSESEESAHFRSNPKRKRDTEREISAEKDLFSDDESINETTEMKAPIPSRSDPPLPEDYGFLDTTNMKVIELSSKKTSEQNVRQSPKPDPPSQKKTVQQNVKQQKSRQSLNSDPSSKIKTLGQTIRVPKSKTPEQKKVELRNSDSTAKKTSRQNVRLPKDRENRKRQLPNESEEQSPESKRGRIAEWVKHVATGRKVSKFPCEVEEKPKRQSVHVKTEKAAKSSISKPKKKTKQKPLILKRYRPYVKCEECGTLQKNIWRHMRQMHERVVEDQKEKKVVAKGGYVIRICPFKDCGAIITRMKDHLVRTHHVQRYTKKLDRLMKQAEPLTERKETPKPKNKPVIIEISDDDSDNIKPIKQEKKEMESDEEQAIASDDKDSVTSMMFQPTQPARKEMEEDSDNDKDSVGSMGFEPSQLSFTPTQMVRKEKKEDSNDDDNDSVGSLGFQPTQLRFTPTQMFQNENEEDSNDDKNSVGALGCEGIIMSSVDDAIFERSETQNRKREMETEAKEINKTIVKHRLDTHRKVDENKVLKGFVKELTLPPNLKPLKVALQHAQQVYDLWEYITPNMRTKDLFEISKLNEWTGQKLLNYAPGTVRSYLSSMGLFTEYLIEKGLVKDIPRCQRFRESLKATARKLKKRAKMRRTVVETEEIETMILPADIQQFLGSKVAKDIERKIEDPCLAVVPSNFYDIRDYMLLRLLQTNAQRPMAVRNITTKSINRAKKTDDGGALITVAQHKTAESGPAVLAINPQLYLFLQSYLHMLRIIPAYPHDPERSIFTTWPRADGTVALMTSSHVNKAIKRIWDQGPVKKAINATRIRKATSTAVRKVIPGSREMLAKHMTHNPETADRHYALFNQRELAVPVTNMISAVMEGKEQEIHNIQKSIESDSRSTVAIMAGQKGCLGNLMKSIHWPKETDNDTDSTEDYEWSSQTEGEKDESSKLIQEDEKDKTNESKKTHGRRSFESNEAEKLIEICEEIIQQETINKSKVMEKVTGNEEGRIIYLQLQSRIGRNRDVWKVITDRLQTEKKRRRIERAQW